MTHRTTLSLTAALLCTLGLGATAHAQTPEALEERCLAENADPSPMIQELREGALRRRPVGSLDLAVGGAAQPGGFGATVMGRAHLQVADPLWVSGQVRGFFGPDSSLVLGDATVGLNFRSYGNQWVPAGTSSSTVEYPAATQGYAIRRTTYHAWTSHCRLRRSDFRIFAGLKTALFFNAPANAGYENSVAVQAGFGRVFQVYRDGRWGFESQVAMMYDPAHHGVGAQLGLSVNIRNFYVGTEMGTQGGRNNFGYSWMTLDLGAHFEL